MSKLLQPLLYSILVTNKKVLSLFSFLKQTQPIVLSLHDDVAQVLQFNRHDNTVDLAGYNEIMLAKGIVVEGNIIDMDAFQFTLTELFSQAKPNSVKGGKLFVNIPHYQLYTFVEDFSSGTKEPFLKESLMTMVKQHSPIPLEELTLEFASAQKGKKLSYAAYGSPVRWQNRLLKACREVGITAIEFVPEPICHKALFPESAEDDLVLFSNQGGRVFLSVFHNGLIYDSYFLTELAEGRPIDCSECFGTVKKTRADFTNHFGSPLSAMSFVGFDEIQKKSIEDHYKTEKNVLSFLDPKHTDGIGKLIPFESKRSTLFGLLHLLIKDESQTGAIIPEEKALKFHRKTF